MGRDTAYYFEVLYPFQDAILSRIAALRTGFYLTGGTAASRGYLAHRFSEDLDLFLNDSPDFGLMAGRIIAGMKQIEGFRVETASRDDRFLRLFVSRGEATMKVEMVNDVPYRIGEPSSHPVLGLLDTPANILANKVSALIDRDEPKDLADIWGFCCRMGLSLDDAIRGAQSKAAGVFPADLARALCSATSSDWELIRWIEAPDVERFKADLGRLGESLILGKPAC